VFKNGLRVRVNDPISKQLFFQPCLNHLMLLELLLDDIRRQCEQDSYFFEFFWIFYPHFKSGQSYGLTSIKTWSKHKIEKWSMDPSYLHQNEPISKFWFHSMIQSSNPSLKSSTSYGRVQDITLYTWFFRYNVSRPCLPILVVATWHKKTMWAGFILFWFFLNFLSSFQIWSKLRFD
jgi:hypothetical protein